MDWKTIIAIHSMQIILYFYSILNTDFSDQWIYQFEDLYEFIEVHNKINMESNRWWDMLHITN